MKSKSHPFNVAIATVFLFVGILSTVNMIRYNHYVKDTLARDEAQEQCQLKTLEALRNWVSFRKDNQQITGAEVYEYFQKYPLPTCNLGAK